ncbi:MULTISPECIES: MarR family winged helix-turn-helix transcriptional regulator [Paraburkholderia]|uniref:MarR family transcriptional regulator n=1 Tax=Paraburkholderia caribensis TaxID=75105 RepID=A0A9Q6S446_9BURK|nr:MULTISPECIES: MarR family transcriptional regulator [Paraburkholderia]ALP66467.1 MarR family transcriptional regulator [Paraburkholderia caribensis]AMV45506.1 MarR family transcriptional regulator [Paraburkholderia caribensis]AUT54598.1 MarR family transcriptional regulator [Paraburkholderia caribensis]MCO4882373.1 MarR family transcriptional regulator [Paraburkholderia caribensis]MDR6387021.1 DNA-binding MarR family transcriptional regulator [Paraburkholderia caribensis]
MPTRHDNPAALSKFTGSLVRRAQQRHVAVWLSEVSAEVTSVQYAALEILQKTPGVNQRQLGDELDVDRSTIADLVARMVRNGLIERSDDPVDKRSYVLFLTADGKKQLASLRPRVEEVERILTARLTQRECLELRRLLLALLPPHE